MDKSNRVKDIARATIRGHELDLWETAKSLLDELKFYKIELLDC